MRTQAGAVRQTGRNVFATCAFRSPSDGWHITHTERYREWGAFGSVEVNYPFPKKDRERIRKERYVIGLNGIYSHLPNEVDHYAYGLQVGFNFLYKKDNEIGGFNSPIFLPITYNLPYFYLFYLRRIFACFLRMKLTELEKGQIGRIVSIEDSPFKEKLLEMGCVPGALIKPILKAPLGDPIAYELAEYTLSVRKKEANSVTIRPLASIFNTQK